MAARGSTGVEDPPPRPGRFVPVYQTGVRDMETIGQTGAAPKWILIVDDALVRQL